MKLLPKAERRSIIKQAYSVRWMIGGFMFTMAETVAQTVGASFIPGPKWLGGLVIGFIFAAAFVARLMAQKKADEATEQVSDVDSP